MISLSIAIQAHPKRADHIAYLLEKIGNGVDVTVVMDTESLGPWPTAKRCWESMDRSTSHSLILQDDVLLCADFLVGALRVLRHRPNVPVAFYANHKAIDEAREAGRSWARIPGEKGVWGQAQCMPTSWVDTFLAWEQRFPDGPTQQGKTVDDDWILGQFFKHHKVSVWATVPSLVEHGAPSGSIIGFSNKNKVARWFIGEDVSALSVDWRKVR